MRSLFSLIAISFVWLNSFVTAQQIGQLLANTDYDYAYNNSPNNQIEMVDLDNDGNLDPVIINQYRNISTITPRHIAVHYKVGNDWDSIQPFNIASGWPSINYCKSGPLNGKFLAHCGSEISVIDPTNWQHNTYQSSLAAISSIVYLPDGTILAATTSDLNIYKSTDQGVSFIPFKIIGNGDPNVQNIFPLGVIYSSEDGQNLSIVTEATAFDPLDLPLLYLYYSTNGGNSWAGRILGISGAYGQVANRNYAPLFTNFSQLSAVVDNNGITHVAVNGYGNGVLPGSTDTTEVFPVLYWNSRDNDWIAITDEFLEHPTDDFGNILRNLRAGNGIGNAYPTISLTPDGEGVVVSWQSFEYSLVNPSGILYNIFPGDGSANSGQVVYTDLYIQYSINGGITWIDHTIKLPTSFGSMTEQYPICWDEIEDIGFPFLFKTHYIYQYDAIPGVSIFNTTIPNQNGTSAEGGWYYDNYSFEFTSIEDPEIIVEDFNLSQNYPNPFNSSTTIKFALPVKTNLNLNVYNTLGEKVAEIFNGELEEGYHEMMFNASGLSSGVYFYKIESENYTATKKLMLLK
jgi:hypothetical protein